MGPQRVASAGVCVVEASSPDAPEGRLADSQVMQGALIGVPWLLGEPYGLLPELGV